MFDMSPEAVKRRDGEAELAAYHMADKGALGAPWSRRMTRLAFQALITSQLAEIYQAEFNAYLDQTGLCPNCDKPMPLLPIKDEPGKTLPRCGCGCERILSNGEWVMRHWVTRGGILVCDHETPLWWWLVCGRDVSAILFEPGEA